jgi:hypothetical protein
MDGHETKRCSARAQKGHETDPDGVTRHSESAKAERRSTRISKRRTHGSWRYNRKAGVGCWREGEVRRDETRLSGTRHVGAGAEVGLEIASFRRGRAGPFYTGSANKGQSILRSSRKRVESELANESAFQRQTARSRREKSVGDQRKGRK